MKITNFSIDTGKMNNNAHFRIAHISDLHKKNFGENNILLVRKIEEICPDAVFMTGDMISRSSKDITPLKHLITGLSENFPVYYSMGNHEKDAAVTNKKLYTELMEFAGKYCTVLDNDTCFIKNENFTLRISGLTVPQECYKVNGQYKNLKTISARDVNVLLNVNIRQVNCQDNVNVLLAHNPNFFDSYAEYGSDVILSGHVHGGCIKLPLIGGLLSPERKFFPKYYSGLYKKGKSSMIVSCGLGKFRLFNPPEICVIDIF